MLHHSAQKSSFVAIVVLGFTLLRPSGSARAHCDTMDGPIIPEARRTLESGDVTPVLKWVRESDEATVREAFARARSVKGEGDEVEAMAEQWFLETLIRIHRQGEGAAYTGLNPAGSAPPFYNAADAALDAGDVDELADRIAAAVRDEIHKRFDRARQLRAHLDDSVPAGREYVKAYIEYMHLVEEVHESVNRVHAAEHFQEGGGHEH